jgi:hypothetical protein
MKALRNENLYRDYNLMFAMPQGYILTMTSDYATTFAIVNIPGLGGSPSTSIQKAPRR